MALYPSNSYGGQKAPSQKGIYIIISSILVIAVAILLFYNPFGRDKDKANKPLAGSAAESKTPAPASSIKPQPKPASSIVKTTAAGISPSVSEPDSSVDRRIDEAMACLNANPPGIIEARDRLNEVLPMTANPQKRSVVKEQLSNLADKWLFSKTVFTQDKLCSSYKVQQGDLLTTIGRQFKVPYEILMEINNISRPETLQAGQTIKVINGPFHAKVYRSTFTMDLYLQNTYVRSFRVGLGKPGMETPTGLWLVKPDGKLIKPTWTDPVTGKTYQADDPDYPLGSRWIGLEGISGGAKNRIGFAIHGTKDPNSIGTVSSQGCVRLHNGNAVLVYNLLMPGLSQVEITE
jgi:lipoprotein-anchoring transpeptidase ErfK/SrfK